MIRETPGWGQSEIGKTGQLHVHDPPSRAEGTTREPTDADRRWAALVGGCCATAGGDAGVLDLEARQAWRERYTVLTPGTLEVRSCCALATARTHLLI